MKRRSLTIVLCLLILVGVLAWTSRAPNGPVSADPGVEWQIAVANLGEAIVKDDGSLRLRTPSTADVAFTGTVEPVQGDYVLCADVSDVKAEQGGYFAHVTDAPMTAQPPITQGYLHQHEKISIYPAGDDFYILYSKSDGGSATWNGSEWEDGFCPTGVPLERRTPYRLEIEREAGVYVCRVLDAAGAALIETAPLAVTEVAHAENPDYLAVGDVWPSYTKGHMTVTGVTLNARPVQFGPAQRHADPVARQTARKVREMEKMLNVTVGEPFTISKAPTHNHFPAIQIGPNGEWIVSFSVWADEINVDAVGAWSITQDKGRTWSEPLKQKMTGPMVTLSDGTILRLSYWCLPRGETDLTVTVGRSTDGGKTFDTSEAPVHMPEKLHVFDQGAGGLVFHRTILEQPNGNLLATMYGYFAADHPKYRCVLVRSADGGNSWDYYSTMAFSPDAPGEGYCEEVVTRTSAGDLLCIMRLSSGLEMQQCRSNDGGKTWSEPVPCGPRAVSVDPDAVLMSNGVLACSYGRPGNHIMFSPDGTGNLWTNHTTIYEGSSTCYTGIREVEPGRLLYVFDARGFVDEPGAEPANCVRGVFIDVAMTE